MVQLRRILVPVDLSACSALALRYGAGLAGQLDGRLTVLHVWELQHYLTDNTPLDAPPDNFSTLGDYARSRAQEALEEFLAELGDLAAPLSTELVTGRPSDVILERAQQEADLVVMGTHGRTGLPHLLLGSTAERVVQRCRVPVLTVRCPKS